MESWVRPSLDELTSFWVSDSGYTSDIIGVEYLEQLLNYWHSLPDPPTKNKPYLLIVDGHGSHQTPQFVLTAYRRHVIVSIFPSHLTHLIQPLDVAIFGPYKHWHQLVLSQSVRTLYFEFRTSDFLDNLPDIRAKALKSHHIIHAFEKPGLWPIQGKKCNRNSKKS